MADKLVKKEVGADGLPLMRVSGYLISAVHGPFVYCLDSLLREGWISDAEYVQLTEGMNAAMTAFRESIPEEIANRPYGGTAYHLAHEAKMEEMKEEAPAMAMYGQEEQEKRNVLTQWLTGLTEKLGRILSKASFDESEWSGSASNYKSAASYCAACLIDTNPSGAEKVKEKCHLPVRKEGSRAINKNALRALASGGRGIPALKGVSSADKAKAAKFAVSHWQAAFDKPAPDSMYMMAGMKPPSAKSKDRDETSVRFFKDKAGDWWMLGLYSNRWKDLQGEILSEAAHAEYAQWVNATGFEPAVTLAHQPRLSEKFWKNMFRRFGNDIPEFNKMIGEIYKDYGFARVKRIIPLNGFVLALAKVDSNKKDVAEKLAKVNNLAMSHGCLAFKETVDFNLDRTPVNIVDKYRSFEVTVLSKGNAANAVTIPIFVEARTMTKSLSDADRDLLSKILPVELVDQVDSVTSSLEKDLNERLAFKDDPEEESKKEATAEEVKEPEATTPAAATTGAEVPAEAAPAAAPAESSEVDAVVEAVIKSLNTDGLKAVLTDIQGQLVELKEKVSELDSLKVTVKELSKSDDEKIAAQLTPPARPGIDWGTAPSRSATNVVADGDQKLKEKETVVVGDDSLNPGNGPNQLDPNNPLHAMLFSKLQAKS